jgi:Flp pilus assembly protein TadG
MADAARRRARRDDERGIAVVWMAVVLFLLLGVAAVAVDLVHGLLVAQKAQNAADAASLAGAVYLPGDEAAAKAEALEVAAENGFTNGVDNVTVTATRKPDDPTKLTVEVKQTFATFFARAIGFDALTVSEDATADYAPPVALGSPENSFGFQPYRGVWGAINGYCSSREDGDLRASRYHSNRPSGAPWNGNTVCPVNGPGPAVQSNDYDAAGYSYLVEMTDTPAGTVALQVFDGPYRVTGGCGGGLPSPAPPVAPVGTPCPDSGSFFSGTPDVTTVFEVWNLNGTRYDSSDDVLMSTTSFGTTNNAALFNRWDTIAMLPSGPGLFRVNIRTNAGQASSVGSNGWALGARVGGGPGSTTAALPRCVNDANETGPTVLYSAGCPHVYAEREMSVFANQANSVATFFLADVGRANAGKTMVITLFDPGEGGQTLEVLDPSGQPASFTWQTIDADTGWTQYSGSGTSLNIAATIPSPLPNHISTSRLSDRKVELRIDLPEDYNPTGTTWWKLRYHFDGGARDRTTWAARIIGNPVRIVE